MKTRSGSGHTQDTGDPDSSRLRGAGEEAGPRKGRQGDRDHGNLFWEGKQTSALVAGGRRGMLGENFQRWQKQAHVSTRRSRGKSCPSAKAEGNYGRKFLG